MHENHNSVEAVAVSCLGNPMQTKVGTGETGPYFGRAVFNQERPLNHSRQRARSTSQSYVLIYVLKGTSSSW